MLRIAAEWAVLVLLGGALGVGTAEAVQAGLVSERTILIGCGVLMAVGVPFVIWSARDLDLIGWDDWDDDAPGNPPAVPPVDPPDA